MRASSQHAAAKYLPGGGQRDRLALCLAGGGTRAALFHLGVVRRCNEFGLLPRIDTISAVSGGSILAGLLARAWAELAFDARGVCDNIDRLIAQPMERFVTKKVRLGGMFWHRLMPGNWAKFSRGDFGAADLLASFLDRHLYRGILLKRLPERPRFIFGATNLRTGALFTFHADGVGEPLIGVCDAGKTRLADAVAASCAAPTSLPPMVMRFDPALFEGGVLGPRGDVFRRIVNLTDGGVHDALAVEPVWKSHATIICSDGGHCVQYAPYYRDWFGNRALRVLALQTERALESTKRWLISAYATGLIAGTYIGLSAYHGNYGLTGSIGYPGDVVDDIRRIRTTIDRFESEETMTLVNHGYTIGDVALRRYLANRLPIEAPFRLPYPDFVDRSKVLGCLENAAQPRDQEAA